MSHLVALTKNGFALVLGICLVLGVQVVVNSHHRAYLSDKALASCIAGGPVFGGIAVE